MKILVDLNLSPKLCDFLTSNGCNAVHWSTVGALTASDHEIMRYALQNQFCVLTQDLDFGAILAATEAVGPSVIQIRSSDILSDTFYEFLIAALNRHWADLEKGAIVVIDEGRDRIRILPI